MLKPHLANADHGEHWINKIQKNIERDKRVNYELERLGWKVLRFWGKDIEQNTDNCILAVEDSIIDSIIELTSVDDP